MTYGSSGDITVVQGDIRYFIMPDDFGPKIGATMVHFDGNERIVVDDGPLKGLKGSFIKVDPANSAQKSSWTFTAAPTPSTWALKISRGKTKTIHQE